MIGVSVDNEYTHYAAPLPEELVDLPIVMASDLKRELTAALGILNKDGVADRATFIIDPHNTIQSVSITADSVGRNTDEVLRQLDALQSDGCAHATGRRCSNHRRIQGDGNPRASITCVRLCLPTRRT